jgi:hypothetical protein
MGDTLRTLTLFIAGGEEKWPAFLQALIENNLKGQKDWRQANSPALWVRGATNRIAAKEYWVRDYAVERL